jgi:DnaJ-class molecular chaperone
MTDLYALLEVPRDASPAALKVAWRRKARALHPDRHGGDPAMVAALAAVNAAYDVLSDPDRRRDYDRYGADAASVFFDADRVEPAPGVPRERRARPVERGEDLTAALPLTTDQARQGGIHTLTVQAERVCPTCQGTGWRRAGRACSKCEGGRIPGKGPYRVQIPPGVVDGQVLIAPGLGQGGRGRNAPPGDLRITVHVPVSYGVEELDQTLELPVAPDTLAEGGILDVPLPDGATARVRWAAGAAGKRIRLRGRGHRGRDLLVRPVARPGPTEVAAVVIDLRGR